MSNNKPLAEINCPKRKKQSGVGPNFGSLNGLKKPVSCRAGRLLGTVVWTTVITLLFIPLTTVLASSSSVLSHCNQPFLLSTEKSNKFNSVVEFKQMTLLYQTKAHHSCWWVDDECTAVALIALRLVHTIVYCFKTCFNISLYLNCNIL